MAYKTAKVVKTTFKREWVSPKSGKIIYYYEMITDNGDIGEIGVMEKGSRRIKEGALIEYEIDDKKYKLLKSSNDASVIAQEAVANKNNPFASRTTGKSKTRNIDEFLGFVWGYSKDLIIAGKSMDDIKKMPEIAEYLYQQVCNMLHNPPSPEPGPVVDKKFLKEMNEMKANPSDDSSSSI